MKAIVNNKCVYPRVEKDQDRRRTVSKEDIKEIKELRKKGIAYHKIAKITKRPTVLVKSYLIPGYKEQFAKYTKKHNNNRYKTDPKFRKKLKEQVAVKMIEKYRNNVEFRIYQSCRSIGCKNVIANYGSLERFRKMKIEMFNFEKNNPKIPKDILREKIFEIRKKYRIPKRK